MTFPPMTTSGTSPAARMVDFFWSQSAETSSHVIETPVSSSRSATQAMSPIAFVSACLATRIFSEFPSPRSSPPPVQPVRTRADAASIAPLTWTARRRPPDRATGRTDRLLVLRAMDLLLVIAARRAGNGPNWWYAPPPGGGGAYHQFG